MAPEIHSLRLQSALCVQDAGTIPRLLPFLGRTNPVSLQLEALHALYNLCKISRTRQEAAAVAGVVPRLIALVSTSPKVLYMYTFSRDSISFIRHYGSQVQSSSIEMPVDRGACIELRSWIFMARYLVVGQATDASVDKEGQQGAQLRPLAISLICGMAHSTQRTRAELWAHNGLELLLNLLQEQVPSLTCLNQEPRLPADILWLHSSSGH